MTVGVTVPHDVHRVQADPAGPASLAEPSRAPLRPAPRPDPAPVFSTTPAPAVRRSTPPAGDRTATALRVAGDRVAGDRVAGDRTAAVVTSLVLTAFGVLIVSGRVVTEGPVVVVLSRTHGVHLGDLGALAAWAAGVAAPLRHVLRDAARRGLRSRTPATSGGARRRRG